MREVKKTLCSHDAIKYPRLNGLSSFSDNKLTGDCPFTFHDLEDFHLHQKLEDLPEPEIEQKVIHSLFYLYLRKLYLYKRRKFLGAVIENMNVELWTQTLQKQPVLFY